MTQTTSTITGRRDESGPALGVLEVIGLGSSLVILDTVEKAGDVRLLQVEFNDFLGLVIKLVGDPAALRAAIGAGESIARKMHASHVTTIIDAPDREAWKAMEAPREYNPLIEQDVVFIPEFQSTTDQNATDAKNEAKKERTVSESHDSFAIGLIETQGFTAVIEAIDTACKAANVEVIGKEKLGGGYVTVLIKGDVAAVEAAVAAGRERVGELGKLIAAHVIARPSESVLALLPNSN